MSTDNQIAPTAMESAALSSAEGIIESAFEAWLKGGNHSIEQLVSDIKAQIVTFVHGLMATEPTPEPSSAPSTLLPPSLTVEIEPIEPIESTPAPETAAPGEQEPVAPVDQTVADPAPAPGPVHADGQNWKIRDDAN